MKELSVHFLGAFDPPALVSPGVRIKITQVAVGGFLLLGAFDGDEDAFALFAQAGVDAARGVFVEGEGQARTAEGEEEDQAGYDQLRSDAAPCQGQPPPSGPSRIVMPSKAAWTLRSLAGMAERWASASL